MQRKHLIFFLVLFSCLQTTSNALAASLSVTSNGSDGVFAPTTSLTLSLDQQSTFNFTDIQIGQGLSVNFNQGGLSVGLLGLNDIVIDGTLDASLLDLTVTTPGRIFVNGNIGANTLLLEANEIWLSSTGIITTQTGTTLSAPSVNIDPAGSLTVQNASPTLSPVLTPIGSGGTSTSSNQQLSQGVLIVNAVPIPAAAWLFGSALLALGSIAGRRRSTCHS
ncbi:MAG: hypothetical protein GC138_02240 [Gammaproteobacteria bacterium]|nr:hypothetical protein [Gammaproteobacteria bacterium]